MKILLQVEQLKKYYPIRGGIFKRKVNDVKAVDVIDLGIFKNECLGLVGESGCGKTTFGKTVVRLLKPTDGHIYFNVPTDIIDEIRKLKHDTSKLLSKKREKLIKQYDLSTFKGSKLKQFRRSAQIVFQDPSTSLNPRMLVKDIVGEPLKVQGLANGPELNERVLNILVKLGLTEKHLSRYPHEFSSGQRQRIAIARAIITNPEFVVLDEPTSSVDVSVRVQLLDVFQSIQRDLQLTYLFISHDLSVVECISDRVGVMYLGKIVELAPTKALYQNPKHPYSVALISSIPIPDPTLERDRVLLAGDVPSPVNPPTGCRFHPRCFKARKICKKEQPLLIEFKDDHFVACHFPVEY